jgi:hypothetical protein
MLWFLLLEDTLVECLSVDVMMSVGRMYGRKTDVTGKVWLAGEVTGFWLT